MPRETTTPKTIEDLLHRSLSDEALGSRLASGEAAAFDELYRRYAHRLAAYGAHLLGDAASGDDVAQSALLKAYAALRDGRVPERVRPWLYRIAHNAAIDLVARRRELPSYPLPDQPAHEPAQRAGALVDALAALPPRQRDVYLLRELHGLRIDETCAELGLTTVQVEQALFAARNRIAEHLAFGERLNCVAVQRLSSGPLDAEERRALKTHLRSCSSCRSVLGVRGRALSVLPAATVDWLRGLGTTLLGGGAPVAAKVGAVVATATVAAGVPAAVRDPLPHARVLADAVAPPAHRVTRRHAETKGHATVSMPAPAPVHDVVAPPDVVVEHPTRHEAPKAEPSRSDDSETSRRGSDEGGDDGSGASPADDAGDGGGD